MKAAVALLLVGASVARGEPAKAAIDKGPAGVSYASRELLVALKDGAGKERVKRLIRPVNAGGRDPCYGYGRVNAAEAAR